MDETLIEKNKRREVKAKPVGTESVIARCFAEALAPTVAWLPLKDVSNG